MPPKISSSILIKQLGWVWIGLFLLVVPVYGQSDWR